VLDAPPQKLWARRSLFTLHDAPLLVTEIFLPDILRLPK
jgi:chorismate lyase